MIRRFINWLLRKQPEPGPEAPTLKFEPMGVDEVDLEAWARSHPGFMTKDRFEEVEAWARAHPEQARMVMPPQVFDEIKRRHDVRGKGQL